MEGNIRKQRQETLYRQRERRQKFVEICAIILAILVGAAALVGFVWLVKTKGSA